MNFEIINLLITVFLPILSYFIFSQIDYSNILKIRDFILSIWLTLIVLFIFSEYYNAYDFYFLSWGFIIGILILNSIHEMYNSDNLEKFLGYFDLLFYSCMKIIFYTRFYIIILTLISINAIGLLVPESKEIKLIILLIGFLYHFITQSKNVFNCKSFKETKAHLQFNFSEDSKYDIDDFFNYKTVNLLIYVEDRYFLDRENIYSTIYLMIANKFKKINEIEYKNKIKSKMNNGVQLANLKNLIKKIYAAIKNKKYLIRGYSNIEQQLIRTQVMLPDSYKYTIRRKIFVEYIYTYLFFKAIKKQNKRYNRYNKLSLKKKIIESYFENIFNLEPIDDNFNEVIEKIHNQSGISKVKLYLISRNIS